MRGDAIRTAGEDSEAFETVVADSETKETIVKMPARAIFLSM